MDTWVFLSVCHISVLGNSMLLQDEALPTSAGTPSPSHKGPELWTNPTGKITGRPAASRWWEETEPFVFFLKVDFIQVSPKVTEATQGWPLSQDWSRRLSWRPGHNQMDLWLWGQNQTGCPLSNFISPGKQNLPFSRDWEPLSRESLG